MEKIFPGSITIMFVKDFNKTALILDKTHISYSDLIRSIKDYSKLMAAQKGRRIAIFFENRPEWFYSFYAGWNCGCLNVLIDMMSTREEVAYILNDCRPGMVIVSDKTAPLLKEVMQELDFSPECINVDSLEIPENLSEVPEYTPSPDETVLMLYTSGTTGNSKGVMLSLANLMKNVRWTNDSKRLNETDRMIAILPAHHSWPLMATVICPLECGATTVFLPKLDAVTLVATLKEHKITMIPAVPRLVEMLHKGIMQKVKKNPVALILLGFCKFLYKIPGNRFFLGRVKVPYATLDIIPLTRLIFKRVFNELGGNLKVFLSGGAKLDKKIIADFRAMGVLTAEGYGLTETAPMITYHPFDKLVPGSVGKVFDDIDLKFDPEGEILLKGPNVTSGYWEKPEQTLEAFDNEGYFKTGDLGYLDKKGFLFLTGRKKDLIVLSNGKNVSPDKIESRIKENYPVVEDIAVTHQKDQLFAVIIPDMEYARRENISDLQDEIKYHVIDLYNKSVENYKKIHDFIITFEDIPKTRLGKVKRFKLQDFIEHNRQKRTRVKKEELPDYEEYKLIAEYLTDISGLQALPSDHLEIDLGLDSLSLMEFQLFLEKSFGLTFKEGELVTFGTVEKLAAYIEGAKTKMTKESINWDQILGASSLAGWKIPKKWWTLRLFNAFFSLTIKKKINLTGSGMEHIPEGPCIIAPNHTSYLDSIAVFNLLKKSQQKDLYFFAKDKNFNNPLYKFFAHRSHVVLMDINKNLKQSLQMIAAILREGKKVLIFPEGTRSRNGKIQHFKSTFATIAKNLSVPVVPAAITGAFEAMPRSKTFPGKGRVRVTFLPPLGAEEKTEQAFVEEIVNAVKNELGKTEQASQENRESKKR